MKPQDLPPFLRDDSGQGSIEYGLIIVLVTAAAFIGLRSLGGKANNTLYAPTISAFNNTP
jgi:Flp pilus assembly pilin Flp